MILKMLHLVLMAKMLLLVLLKVEILYYGM